ncbi:MAG: ParB/RepB/Spo0J family partition protein [Candidatus Omnitrophota bacterium]|nr:ParB/RepB/Spo0J family partition protein [Candidatus Omnitrophota bacterium]
MEKKALGKGLSALIPEQIGRKKEEGMLHVRTDRIKQNPLQPRENFGQEKLDELVLSIKEKGMLQPVLVRDKDGGYELIAGERRLKAAKAAGIEEIPVIIKNVGDAGALELALIENIQREELNSIEEAKAFRKLIDRFEFSQEDVARAVGKNRATVSNTLRLLGLPKRAQELVANGELTMGHARALLALSGEHTILKLSNRILRKGLSVREVENIVSKNKPRAKTEIPKAADHKVMFFEEELQRALGTKVKIQHGKKRGKIQIDYYSFDDMERIYNLIKKAPITS